MWEFILKKYPREDHHSLGGLSAPDRSQNLIQITKGNAKIVTSHIKHTIGICSRVSFLSIMGPTLTITLQRQGDSLKIQS